MNTFLGYIIATGLAINPIAINQKLIDNNSGFVFVDAVGYGCSVDIPFIAAHSDKPMGSKIRSLLISDTVYYNGCRYKIKHRVIHLASDPKKIQQYLKPGTIIIQSCRGTRSRNLFYIGYSY